MSVTCVSTSPAAEFASQDKFSEAKSQENGSCTAVEHLPNPI